MFLSVAYESNYIEMLDAIENHMHEHLELKPESTFFWFSALVNDQWRAFERDFNWWSTTFHEAVEDIGYTLCFFSSWRVRDDRVDDYINFFVPWLFPQGQAIVYHTRLVLIRVVVLQQEVGNHTEQGAAPSLPQHAAGKE